MPSGESTTTTSTEPHAEFALEFVDELPGGRLVMPVERKGKFVWLVVKGAMQVQAAAELVEHLQFIVSMGLWRQNWNPPTDPEPTTGL